MAASARPAAQRGLPPGGPRTAGPGEVDSTLRRAGVPNTRAMLVASDDGVPWHLSWLGSPLKVAMSPVAYTNTKRRPAAEDAAGGACRSESPWSGRLALPHSRQSPWLLPHPSNSDYGSCYCTADSLPRVAGARSTSPQRWRNRLAAHQGAHAPPLPPRPASHRRHAAGKPAELRDGGTNSAAGGGASAARICVGLPKRYVWSPRVLGTPAAQAEPTPLQLMPPSTAPAGQSRREPGPMPASLPDMRRCYFHRTI
eukprot:TRINITY_DN60071_c0_g1_i1.p1 TRINITY_DN60071_c0_g1~~TRINITY_DN60071_c0_g1_i1.p1  ORF type:complete len:255 (+),score=36.26 TRINITY_DN60071_c0_g1_i1:99-863(+)